MDFDGLTDEQKAKARAATTPEEILAIAREGGYELSDEELEAISGGCWSGCSDNCGSDGPCPYLNCRVKL